MTRGPEDHPINIIEVLLTRVPNDTECLLGDGIIPRGQRAIQTDSTRYLHFRCFRELIRKASQDINIDIKILHQKSLGLN
jgi:hypothetical protein